MIVPSPGFLLFSIVAALIFNALQSFRFRQFVLLAANLAFITTFAGSFWSFLPLAGFLALGFVAQRLCGGASSARFVAAILLTIGVFVWLKRYSFVPQEAILSFPYLVIGLSYIFFRVLHVVIDRHQGAIEAPLGPLSYLNYTLNFATLISGPIQRYQDFQSMETGRLRLDLPVIGRSVERIIIGYFKVAVVSAMLWQVQHQAIAALPTASGLLARIAAGMQILGLYPIYLYFNFSGYTDVVIGVARFFRIELPENFDRPFLAENVLTFWNRWHMTLSGWLKTYVFNPLMLAGMSRITAPSLAPYIAVAAFFCTFFLVGVWHGQTTAFLVFGLLTGGGVAANKLWQVMLVQRLGRNASRALAANPVYRACCRGLNFTWFAFTLLWFWSDGAANAALVRVLGPTGALGTALGVFVSATAGLAVLSAAEDAMSVGAGGWPVARSRYLRTVSATALCITVVALVTLLRAPAPDIVYKTF